MNDQPKVDNLLHISWHDSRWVPILNPTNVIDYFSERSNPFYTRECNNEFIKMQQNARADQLQHMTGLEYCLLHAQEPILYIVRKQHRHSPTQASPLACYHIIGGQVFQTPDLGSVINSRLVSSINHLGTAFSELQSLASYHPSKGYQWKTQKPNTETDEEKKNENKGNSVDEAATMFQRQRVDQLLSVLTSQFPPKHPPQPQAPPSDSARLSQPNATSQQNGSVKGEDTKSDFKVENRQNKILDKDENSQGSSQQNSRPPPSKRQKIAP